MIHNGIEYVDASFMPRGSIILRGALCSMLERRVLITSFVNAPDMASLAGPRECRPVWLLDLTRTWRWFPDDVSGGSKITGVVSGDSVEGSLRRSRLQ